MLGMDFLGIRKCYDLKGSLLGRFTKVSEYQDITGDTGIKVLKDKNFIANQETEDKRV
jgi:hypothetical protein